MSEQGSFFEESPLSDEDASLVEAYLHVGRTVDELAYTDDFDRLFAMLQESGDRRTKAEVFRRLLNLRKTGRLPRIVN